MNSHQFIHMVRSYAALATRMRKDYSRLVDYAGNEYYARLVSQGMVEEDAWARVERIKAQEYPAALRSYPAP